MTSNEIRQRFLAFMVSKGHAVIPSASLVPDNDPTVLFTTAGMHPLIANLLGEPHSAGKRLTSVQKCVRTQDIEEVGDNRHDTFFEMMGNWSLGDYFKEETIPWSWEFLTDDVYGLGLEPDRLYVTVFAGDKDAPRDEKSIEIWQDLFMKSGISCEVDMPIDQGGRIFTMNKESNWWGPAGITGPCGPDTEIHYDLRGMFLEQAVKECKIQDKEVDQCFGLILPNSMPDFDSGRLVEIWNNVFMEYFKQEDGSFTKLNQKNVDTGLGLERICMVLQVVSNVFETDLLSPIVRKLQVILPETIKERSLYIVADHLRTAIFMASDGVVPSNKDRGYVMRRLVRRAILHSEFENLDWVEDIVEIVVAIYRKQKIDIDGNMIGEEGDNWYPNLHENQADIVKVLTDEAHKFQKSLKKGMQEISKREKLTGKEAFDLYQTYGFPLELTIEYAEEKGVQIDRAEFEAEFTRHKEMSKTAAVGQFKSGLADHTEITVQYHTAAHLIHQALRNALGTDVVQKGSNITAERIRFDFAYGEKMTEEQVAQVEAEVNQVITEGLAVKVESMSPTEATAQGALGVFGHKYGDSVTVYTIGEDAGEKVYYSKEICAGPHVENTKELRPIKITKQEAVSAGVRRIKAVFV